MRDGPEQEARDEIFLSQLGKEIVGAFPSRWSGCGFTISTSQVSDLYLGLVPLFSIGYIVMMP